MKKYLIILIFVSLFILCTSAGSYASNDYICVFAKEVGGIYQIFVADKDFQKVEQLTFGDVRCYNPKWSPDGSKIAYRCGNTNPLDLVVMNSDGSNNCVVVNANIGILGWHNNGNQIIFRLGVSTSEDIIKIINIDGTSLQTLIDHPNDKDLDPQMNPMNSNQVLYLFDSGNWTPNRQLRIRNLSTGQDVLLVDRNGLADHNPSFSPDGKNVIWSESSYSYTGYGKLKRVNIETKKIDLVYDNPSAKGTVLARYTSDGKVIYFSQQNGDGTYSMWRCNSDGSGLQELMSSNTSFHLGDVTGVSNVVIPEDVSSGIEGFIHDQKTGQPLQSATVTIDGKQDVSDSKGYYKITNNFNGQYDLAVSKNGYYPVTRQVYVSSGSTKVSNFKLTSTTEIGLGVPVITNSFCDYKGVFLGDVTLKNEYGVMVDWQGSPGHVEFILNGTTHTEVGSVFGANHTFDMGHDFRPNSLPFGNTLEIVVVNGEGQRSEPAKFHPVVTPVPDWCYSVGYSFFTVSADSGGNISFKTSLSHPSKPFTGQVAMPSGFPFLGGHHFGLKETQAGFSLVINSTGSASLSLGGQTGFTAGGSTLVGKVSGAGEVEYIPGNGLEWMSASFGIGIGGELEFSQPVVALFPGMVGVVNIPGIKQIVDKAKLGMVISPGIDLLLNFINDNGLAFESTEIGAEIGLKLFLKLEIIKSISAVLYGGGEIGVTFQVPSDPDFLKALEAALFAGVEVKVWLYHEKFEGKFSWTYPEERFAVVRNSSFPEITQDVSLKPIEPDFIKFGQYMRSARNMIEGLRTAGNDNPKSYNILENVYRYSEPAIAEKDGTSVITFVYYDANDELLRNTEIYYSIFDGSSFSTPLPILDDTRAEFYPQVAFDVNGNAIAVWERVKNEAFPVDGELSEMAAEFELVFAVYDPVANTWSMPTAITDNDYLDYNPVLKRNSDGELLLIWESNENNEIEPSIAAPGKINYCIWNGSQWSTPVIAMDNVSRAFQFDAAFWPEGAMLVWTQDMDDDLTTGTDQEIYYNLFTGTPAVWSGPQRLTNNTISDSNPRVEGNSAGSFHLLWYSNDGIVQLTDLDNGLYQQVRQDDVSGSGSIDFRISLDNSSNLALIWQGQNDKGSDIYYRIYDDNNNSWSLDRQLTSDDAMEKFNQPIFGSDNSLMIAYNKALTEYVTKEVEIDGQWVTINNVPQQGRNDLNLLTYKPTEDLGFAEGALTFTEEPAPGVQTTINATVSNFGDMAMTDVRVSFYDGDPDDEGIQIGSIQFVSGGLDAGDSDQVSVAWIVPDDGRAHTIFAKVDPESLIVESNEDNNTISVATLLPDVAYVSGQAQVAGNNQISLVATVSNSGTVAASNVAVDFYLDSIDGEFLGRRIIASLAAGSTAEVFLPWASDGSGLLLGNDMIVISLDQSAQIIEGNETNNQGTITTLIGRSVDTGKAYVCKNSSSNKLPQYESIQNAVNAVVSPGTVMIQSDSFSGDVEVNASGTVVLQGGYEDNFETLDGDSVISGCLIINSGMVEVNQLVISGQ